jgi:hypothetical protein
MKRKFTSYFGYGNYYISIIVPLGGIGWKGH